VGEVRTLYLSHLTRPLAFVDSQAVEEVFHGLLKGWDARGGAPKDADSAVIRVIAGNDGYRIECAWLSQSRRFDHKVDAACALIAELSQALLEEYRRLLCLHSGAVEIGGSLVVLPSHYDAGKSVFAACCAARGHRVFADDVLPLVSDPRGGDRGRALGFAPRLRLPLPDDLSGRARAFVDSHSGPASARYRYLKLGDGHLAPFGAEAEIGAFVLLERSAGSEPRLADVGVGEMLRHVVLRNFARDLPASAILTRLYRLVARARRLRLSYGNAEAAVQRLMEALSDRPGGVGTASPDRDTLLRRPTEPPAELPMQPGCYLRHPGVATMEVDGETFLIDPQDRSIHHLNPMAAGLWRLFAEPTSNDEALSVLRAAFPNLPSRQGEADLMQLTLRLRRHGLLLSAEDPPA